MGFVSDSLDFSEYIVYVDESGDHSLDPINPDYPVFVLAFCLIRKQDYCDLIVPAVQKLKFKYFGHDMVILHESEIRKSRPPFDILLNETVRKQFLRDLANLIEAAPFTLVASCIMKNDFHGRRGDDDNPYHIAMEFGLERVFLALQERGQRGRLTHVVFEQRGRQEDRSLELEFRRIMDRTTMQGMAESLDLMMVSKQVNSAGLQLADMFARPIGRHLLDPDQRNRAYELLRGKFRASPQGSIRGRGLKVYP